MPEFFNTVLTCQDRQADKNHRICFRFPKTKHFREKFPADEHIISPQEAKALQALSTEKGCGFVGINGHCIASIETGFLVHAYDFPKSGASIPIEERSFDPFTGQFKGRVIRNNDFKTIHEALSVQRLSVSFRRDLPHNKYLVTPPGGLRAMVFSNKDSVLFLESADYSDKQTENDSIIGAYNDKIQQLFSFRTEAGALVIPKNMKAPQRAEMKAMAALLLPALESFRLATSKPHKETFGLPRLDKNQAFFDFDGKKGASLF